MAQLRDKRLFLLDMDGTIYLDETLFEAVPEFLAQVRSVGGKYLFLTNNSSKGLEGYIAKMHRLGIEGTVRASFGLYNTQEEADALVEGIRRVAKMF